MAINPKQFVSISKFHRNNLNVLLEQYIDLPEAPGILRAMLYLQESINRASELIPAEDNGETTE